MNRFSIQMMSLVPALCPQPLSVGFMLRTRKSRFKYPLHVNNKVYAKLSFCLISLDWTCSFTNWFTHSFICFPLRQLLSGYCPISQHPATVIWDSKSTWLSSSSLQKQLIGLPFPLTKACREAVRGAVLCLPLVKPKNHGMPLWDHKVESLGKQGERGGYRPLQPNTAPPKTGAPSVMPAYFPPRVKKGTSWITLFIQAKKKTPAPASAICFLRNRSSQARVRKTRGW